MASSSDCCRRVCGVDLNGKVCCYLASACSNALVEHPDAGESRSLGADARHERVIEVSRRDAALSVVVACLGFAFRGALWRNFRQTKAVFEVSLLFRFFDLTSFAFIFGPSLQCFSC